MNLFDDHFQTIYDYLLRSLEEQRGGPFGAGLIIDNRLIAVGSNEVWKTGDVSRHAEVVTLSYAAQAEGRIHLPDAILLSTHYPCMMCYHAIKWAKIRSAYYLFNIEETEKLFSFTGDSAFLADLGLTSSDLDNDPSLRLIRYESPLTKKLYFEDLTTLWQEKYQEKLGGYDIGD